MLYENVLNILDRSHFERVSNLTRVLARFAGFSEAESTRLADAARYHDIGKVAIPDKILNSPDPLTVEQRKIVERHVEYGLALMEIHTSAEMVLAKEIIATHHERWDGKGYPHGIQGEEIPVSGRIVAMCDVFDALAFSRPYKPAWGMKKSINYVLDNCGSLFDPQLYTPFNETIESVFGISASMHSSRAGPTVQQC